MSYSESRGEVAAYIKERSDIVEIIGEHVNLKRTGVRYLGLCPFHDEKTPSFSVHSGQQFFYCFGCGKSGDVFSFMMEYHHLDFPSAVKALAERYQIELPERKKTRKQLEQDHRRKKMYELNRKTAVVYQSYLNDSPRGDLARSYLEKRGISSSLQKRYQLGFAPSPDVAGWNFLGGKLDAAEKKLAVESGLLVKKEKGGTYDRFRGRIIFPVIDLRGRVAGFGGRTIIDEKAKYINSPESLVYHKGRMLFGLYHQRDEIRKSGRAVLVEGNFDLLSLVEKGFGHVAAPLGTALTREQIRLLKPMAKEVVLLFDGDSAGIKAALRTVPLFLAEQVNGRVAVLPDRHDPDTYIREFGREELVNLVENSETLPEFAVSWLVDEYGLSLGGKGRIVEELKPLMAAASSSLQRSVMAGHFAEILGVEPEVLLEKRPPVVMRERESVAFQSENEIGQKPLKPLDIPLKSLVNHMVLYPGHFPVLRDAGLEAVLEGTVAEVICLQLAILCQNGLTTLQPEDLLTALPDGEERTLVAEILKHANQVKPGEDTFQDETDELQAFLAWLRRVRLEKESDTIVARLLDAQKNNDFNEMKVLLERKTRIDAELKG